MPHFTEHSPLFLPLSNLLYAQETPQQIPLWPGGAPGFESRRDEPEQAKDWWVRNVHNPSITVFLPPREKATGNRKSLDDVMRSLYKKYYLKKKRGFTEAEFRQECERMAGSGLSEIFDYASTTKEPDYKKYLGFAGLDIDTAQLALPGGWSGIQTKIRDDTIFIASVDWESPAWQAGLRAKDVLFEMNGQKAVNQQMEPVMADRRPGDQIEWLVWKNGEKKKITFRLARKKEASFRITRKANPDALQRKILDSWLK